MNFSDLQIENKLKKSIELAEFKTPTPIQSQSTPMINKLIKDKNAMGLIVCPTRELAT
jgi:ATP-dependent RNA helicase DeaD